jgi:hypothetical protein
MYPSPIKPRKRAREAPAAARTAREGTRRSLRARGVVAAAVDEDAPADDEPSEEEGPAPIDYGNWPIEPTDVDDDEFLAFAELRKFRLARAREFELLPQQDRDLGQVEDARELGAKAVRLGLGGPDAPALNQLVGARGVVEARRPRRVVAPATHHLQERPVHRNFVRLEHRAG